MELLKIATPGIKPPAPNRISPDSFIGYANHDCKKGDYVSVDITNLWNNHLAHQPRREDRRMINGMMGYTTGMPVVVDPNLPRFAMEQFRFPRSKSRRIRKKFSKNNGNYKQVPLKSVYVLNGNTVVVHPDDIQRIKHM